MSQQSEVMDVPRVEEAAEKESQAHDSASAGVTHDTEPKSDGLKTGFPQLPDELERDLVQVFKLLSDETRLKVLLALAREGELHVSAICELMNQSQPAVSHHLALLRVAGLIEARRDGKHNYYSVRRTPFYRLVEALFDSMAGQTKDEVRFKDFVLTHTS